MKRLIYSALGKDYTWLLFWMIMVFIVVASGPGMMSDNYLWGMGLFFLGICLFFLSKAFPKLNGFLWFLAIGCIIAQVFFHLIVIIGL